MKNFSLSPGIEPDSSSPESPIYTTRPYSHNSTSEYVVYNYIYEYDYDYDYDYMYTLIIVIVGEFIKGCVAVDEVVYMGSYLTI